MTCPACGSGIITGITGHPHRTCLSCNNRWSLDDATQTELDL